MKTQKKVRDITSGYKGGMRFGLIYLSSSFALLLTEAILQRSARPVVEAVSVKRGSPRPQAWKPAGEPRFISDAMLKRIYEGTLSPRDVSSMFPLNYLDERALSAGTVHKLRETNRACCMIGLESALMDTTTLLNHGFGILANELGLPAPSSTNVTSCYGLSLHQYFIAFQWPWEICCNKNVETKFVDIIEKLLQAGLRPELRAGALEILDEWKSLEHPLKKSDYCTFSIGIFSAFPRKIAVMLLAANQSILKSCVAKNFLSRSLIAAEQFTSMESLLVQCIVKSSRNPALIVVVDSNAKTLLHAKQLGMACVGIPSDASKYHALNVADKVIPSLLDLSVHSLLSVIVGSFQRNEIPVVETASTPNIPSQEVRSVSSSSMDRDRKPSDTFADEYDNDRY